MDSLYRQAILRARGMAPEEKFPAGPRLFDDACRVTLDGIRNQFPGRASITRGRPDPAGLLSFTEMLLFLPRYGIRKEL